MLLLFFSHITQFYLLKHSWLVAYNLRFNMDLSLKCGIKNSDTDSRKTRKKVSIRNYSTNSDSAVELKGLSVFPGGVT
jgi:hypothetical protein